jgi:hypothetical protein
MLRIPYYVENWLTNGGDVVSFTHGSRSTPTETFIYFSLMLISEKIPRPNVAGRIKLTDGIKLRRRINL